MSTANVIERNIHNNMIRISDKVISYIKLAISDTIYQPAKNRLAGSCEFAKIYISAVYIHFGRMQMKVAVRKYANLDNSVT